MSVKRKMGMMTTMTFTTNDLTRRGFLATTTAAIGMAAMPAFALNTAEAESLIDRVVERINGVINSGKTESSMYGEFEQIFGEFGDLNYIAYKTLGPPARSASKAQMKSYTKAFQGYMARKYGKRFREFIGGRLEVEKVKKVKTWYEVSTTAYLRGEAPFDVTFLVSDRTGSDKFFNLYIEGVNMLLTERTEIGAMLDKRKGNLDKLIADLPSAG